MNEPDLVRTCREVVEQRNCVVIDDRTGLIRPEHPADPVEEREEAENKGKEVVKQDAEILDLQSANMVVQVYDAISADNKAKFQALVIRYGCAVLITKLWRLVK